MLSTNIQIFINVLNRLSRDHYSAKEIAEYINHNYNSLIIDALRTLPEGMLDHNVIDAISLL